MAQIAAENPTLTAREAELANWAERLETEPPQTLLRWAADRYAPRLSLACSFGMQSVVIIDMLAQADLLDKVDVFYLDTGVLFTETHQTRLKIQQKYGFQATRVASELSWQQQQEKFGGHLYEQGAEGINQCCHIRKVEPLRKYLAGRDAWITGMRRKHATTRASLPVVMWDAANDVAKINPLAAFDDATIWGYIKANDVPYNPLYDQGYKSIGCDTPVCTIKPGESDDARGGRWAGSTKTECGIHVDGRVIKSMDSSQL